LQMLWTTTPIVPDHWLGYEKKLLIEYNKLRDPGCWLEGKSETAWLRPQRRHYPFSNRNSAEIFKIVKHEYISDRASWITIAPPENKEKRFVFPFGQ
uniref:Uncharacterized protein n=1 Tax=Podarcis muralis TaxID=64176 RepID=A0A670I4W3_PODMU